jgi:hypothetical protein
MAASDSIKLSGSTCDVLNGHKQIFRSLGLRGDDKLVFAAFAAASRLLISAASVHQARQWRELIRICEPAEAAARVEKRFRGSFVNGAKLQHRPYAGTTPIPEKQDGLTFRSARL